MPHSLRWWDRLFLRLKFAIRPYSLGLKGEWVARRFLRARGLTIIAHSYWTQHGEIDLIAVDGRVIVFVEVKTRSSDVAGSGAEAVDETKQRHIALAATDFLRAKRLLQAAIRFDVVALTWEVETDWPHIAYYRAAFEPPGRFQLYS